MNKSQRIHLSSGDTGNDNQDKYIKVKLEQDVDTLEFMSISLGTTDVYQNFNSDYGVLIGRVIAYGGVGIPNAKISIFIPLTDEDAQDPDIYSFYPYKTPRDKNNDGKRYNLLPRVAELDKTGQISPKQPFGSFPIKEEVVGNQPILEVYKKYYKYTALTNDSGDYMIFGVPTGTQTVHLSLDITDIGEFSMTPAAMVTNLGYSPNLFTDNNTKIKPSTDLNDLPNIETQEITVDVRPFWGDTENFEIGITRQDFRVRSILSNSFTVFGSVFTDSNNTIWGQDLVKFDSRINELNKLNEDEWESASISTKRIGLISEKIYYYPVDVSDEEIDASIINPNNDPLYEKMKILDKSDYSVYKRNGDFAFIINCNRNKIITDDRGNKILIDNNSIDGVFSKFRGFITLELSLNDVPSNATSDISTSIKLENIRFKLKFPQQAPRNGSFNLEEQQSNENNIWRNQSFTFENSKYYSFSRFHGTVYCQNEEDNSSNYETWRNNQLRSFNGFWNEDKINYAGNKLHFWNSGIILSGDIINDEYDIDNKKMEFPSNCIVHGNYKGFGAQWMNLSIYLPQTTLVNGKYKKIDYVRGLTNFSRQTKGERWSEYNNYYYFDNTQDIAAGDVNTKFFARSDLHWTDIIEVPLSDIQKMKKINKKGFTLTELPLTGETYRNGDYIPVNPTINWDSACPLNGGKVNGEPTAPSDKETYFYKGIGSANCIDYLYEIGIVT